MQKTFSYSLIVIVALIVAGLVYLLAPILTPFLVAAILAYLANPLVELLERRHVPRLLSVVIVFLVLYSVIILLILLLIPLIQTQIIALSSALPDMLSWLQNTIIPWLQERFGIQEIINIDVVKKTLAANWAKAGGVASWLVQIVFHSGMALIAFFTSLVLIPVVTFYLLRDWRLVLQSLRSLLPRHIEPTVVKLVKEGDDVLSSFFRGQLLVMLSLGIIYSIGLTAVGLRIGLIIGIVAGLVSIVPYLGFIVGIVSASIAAYVQFGTFMPVLYVWIVFAIGQALESSLLTPKLVGDRIGLHPVAVIFAVLTGGSLFGFFGVLLALPVAAVVMVWLRFLNQRYRHSRLYKA